MFLSTLDPKHLLQMKERKNEFRHGGWRKYRLPHIPFIPGFLQATVDHSEGPPISCTQAMHWLCQTQNLNMKIIFAKATSVAGTILMMGKDICSLAHPYSVTHRQAPLMFLRKISSPIGRRMLRESHSLFFRGSMCTLFCTPDCDNKQTNQEDASERYLILDPHGNECTSPSLSMLKRAKAGPTKSWHCFQVCSLPLYILALPLVPLIPRLLIKLCTQANTLSPLSGSRLPSALPAAKMCALCTSRYHRKMVSVQKELTKYFPE